MSNESFGVCKTCDNSIYFPDCAANITKFVTGPCLGDVVTIFPFSTCHDDGLGASREYFLNTCFLGCFHINILVITYLCIICFTIGF